MVRRRGWPWLAMGVLLWLPACRTARPRGLFVDFSRFPPPQGRAYLDDLMVWPVAVPPGPWGAALEDRLTRRLREGLLDRNYSLLSLPRTLQLAERFGRDQAGALKAAAELGADGVLLVTVESWDEAGLPNAGVLRAAGRFELLEPGGKALWRGRFRIDQQVVDSWSEVRGLEARRGLAADRLAAGLAQRFPPHQLH